ncbi:hypothetical protein VT50_0210045 [Streptomyces antioxidans]|uniref:N-acetyltransferase domain-containing protein n=1 Tax=Streptomyces antioxidans TaxID=1507734 RepID=A0A1V4D8A0_9ACTN|nr:hypothetical protein [Streptomyces antioxidans]OPF81403.1 hypothetical protein VT50_0210045 [Streptomyces antioxidans]
MNIRDITPADLDRLRALAPDDTHIDGHAGVIGTSVDHAVLWRDGVHPLTDRRERQFVQLADRPPVHWQDLLRAALAALPHDISQVRVEVRPSDHGGAFGDALRASGFVDQILRIRKDIADIAEPDLPAETCIRQLAAGEEHFAVHCVSRAITQALDAPVPPSRVSQFVSDWLNDGWSAQTLRSYVVECAGVLVAHALVSLDGSAGELVDVVIPNDDQRSRGWSRVLSTFVEARLSREGVSLLGGTVVTPNGVYPNQLVKNLTRAGWRVESVSMIRKTR